MEDEVERTLIKSLENEMKKILKIFLIWLELSLLLFAQKTGLPEITENNIDLFIQRAMEAYKIPGMAVGIVYRGETIFAKGFGVRDLNTKKPVTAESVFHMASVSKPFSATAIMQLVEKGKCRLDDKITKYLPYFKLEDERYKEITIRHILAHISGLPDVDNYNWDKPEYDDYALERYVKSLTNVKMIFAPGENFSYSNMAFEVIGDLIAKISGLSFENYIKQNIFTPLKMKKSSFLISDIMPDFKVSPHIMNLNIKVSSIYPYNRSHAPSSTMQSNILDMCRWAVANLNKGKLDGSRILNESSYDLLWTQSQKNNGEKISAGLSWFIRNVDGDLIVSHTGSDTGFRSYIRLYPGRSFGIIFMCNSEVVPLAEIMDGIKLITENSQPSEIKKPIVISMVDIIEKSGVAEAVKYYRKAKEVGLQSYDVSENLFFRIIIALNRAERYMESIEIHKLYAEEYPNSFIVYQSLGEVYEKCGYKKLALENYSKSLKLFSDNNELKLKIETLSKIIE